MTFIVIIIILSLLILPTIVTKIINKWCGSKYWYFKYAPIIALYVTYRLWRGEFTGVGYDGWAKGIIEILIGYPLYIGDGIALITALVCDLSNLKKNRYNF